MSTHTRTRTVKPSIRLRQSSSPKSALQFPPPHVILHPDDANSKILNALARALLSVDNRAMTIKDLSEMVVHYGYVSQSSSAASQAILTYLRNHYARCDAQQDHPLLLRHTMSGSNSDDYLLPALYSTSGGAHDSQPSDRRTNFRKGTTVWYLSRVTGAPCPFGRANIRLSDYAMPSSSTATSNDHERASSMPSVRCGQKRKRRSTRECVLRQQNPRSSSPLSSLSSDDDNRHYDDNDEDDDSHSSDTDDDDDQLDEQPPPKVKLTLKLPPLAQVMAENRSNTINVQKVAPDHQQALPEQRESCLPPYPRRSISIPPYTPSTEFAVYPCFNSSYKPVPPPSNPQQSLSSRRSPSIPHSVASPPPDSEDEEGSVSDHIDADSPSPHAPAPLYLDSSDIDGDEDEDDEDDADYEDPEMDVDRDEFSSSDWDEDEDDLDQEGDSFSTWDSPGPRSPSAPPLSAAPVLVKEEPTDVQGILDQWEDVLDAEPQVKIEPPEWKWDSDSTSHEQWKTSSSSSASSSPPHIKQEEDTSPFDFSLSFSGPSFTDWRSSSVDPVSPTSPVASSQQPFFFSPEPDLPSDPTITQSLVTLIHTMSVTSPTALFPDHNKAVAPPASSAPCISPDDTRIQRSSDGSSGANGDVVVHTCHPCVPQIHATQLEGIPVYQTTLGPHVVTRRIDTDFVNLTPLLKHTLCQAPDVNNIPGATVVSKGSPDVQGLWVPLSVAQTYNQALGNLLPAFMNDHLVELFPSAVKEYAKPRPSRVFGKGFASGMQPMEVVDAVTTVPAPAPLTQLQMVSPPLSEEVSMLPLSPREEEIFQELCVNLEWEEPMPMSAKTVMVDDRTPLSMSRSPSPLSSCPPSPQLATAPPPPAAPNPNLRRSKRVAASAGTGTVKTTRSAAAKTRTTRKSRNV
ncbi:hypothetical protein V5O48_002046 [Marasmius crinis-equi]|uniref:GDS1 winged helix domain-containing protein n=1 Tax=Marasmius crinis-equi TaxID=585013 RepID=A0ABR3FXA5_9AGAR